MYIYLSPLAPPPLLPPSLSLPFSMKFRLRNEYTVYITELLRRSSLSPITLQHGLRYVSFAGSGELSKESETSESVRAPLIPL